MNYDPLHLHLSPLDCAVIAWGASRFRYRHQYKLPGSRRGVLVRKNKIKDISASGMANRDARRWIKLARARGWRGSIREAVMSLPSPNSQNSVNSVKKPHP